MWGGACHGANSPADRGCRMRASAPEPAAAGPPPRRIRAGPIRFAQAPPPHRGAAGAAAPPWSAARAAAPNPRNAPGALPGSPAPAIAGSAAFPPGPEAVPARRPGGGRSRRSRPARWQTGRCKSAPVGPKPAGSVSGFLAPLRGGALARRSSGPGRILRQSRRPPCRRRRLFGDALHRLCRPVHPAPPARRRRP